MSRLFGIYEQSVDPRLIIAADETCEDLCITVGKVAIY
jgi:hypothetical protein